MIDGEPDHLRVWFRRRLVCSCGDFNCASLDYPAAASTQPSHHEET